MFIYSLKASTLKFFGVIGIAVVTLAALMFLIPTYTTETTAEIAAMNKEISFDNVKSVSDGASFLSQYGWEVDQLPVEECEITVPREFDKVMTSYNEIQKQQGLDLSKFAKKTAKRYTYKNKVIAGDICSADAKGFIHTLWMPDTK